MYVEYKQSTGTLWFYHGGSLVPLGRGSAGAAGYINDPSSDHLRGKGPLPKGVYRMGIVPHPRFKAPAIRLIQVGGKSHGRSGFWVHGGTKSEGCILLQRPDRVALATLIRRHGEALSLRVVP